MDIHLSLKRHRYILQTIVKKTPKMRMEMIKNAPKQLLSLFKSLCNYARGLDKYKPFSSLFNKVKGATLARIKALLVSAAGISFLKSLLRNESLFANSNRQGIRKRTKTSR